VKNDGTREQDPTSDAAGTGAEADENRHRLEREAADGLIKVSDKVINADRKKDRLSGACKPWARKRSHLLVGESKVCCASGASAALQASQDNES
jgi:hypothetical protein